jgi:SAM-dependent methyltransferase
MKAEHPGRALELGCGTGILHRFFEPGTYVGVDVDSGRIELARKLHPGYEFIVGDAAALDPQWLATFSFVFCFAFLHHVDDDCVMRIFGAFDRASELAAKPIYFLVNEPRMPEETFSNIPGYVLCKLDRGRYMRKLSRFQIVAGPRISTLNHGPGPWYWPVPGFCALLKFTGASRPAGTDSEKPLARGSAHA